MSHENRAQQEGSSLKHIALLTPFLLLILLVGSIVFYKQRMLYIDAPHILFRIINFKNFWIEQHRYGSFISQMLPLAGVYLHLPLAWLMIVYSAGFYLFYLAVSLIIFFRFRNYGLVILLGLYFTLFVSDTYYWPNNEVHQGIAWLLLVFAFNFSVAAKGKNILAVSLLFTPAFFLAIWTHPLIMFAAIYLWFFYMGSSAWPYSKKQSVVLSIIILLLSYFKFYQGMHSWYDSGKIEMVTQFRLQNIKTILSSPQLHFFLSSCIRHYIFFTLLFIAGLSGLLADKKYILLAWTILFVCGYIALMCITFRDVTLREYLEGEYMPLVIICCAPFIYYVLPRINARLAVGLFAVIYLFRLTGIYSSAKPYTNRITLMENVNKKMEEKHLTKVIIPEPVNAVDSLLIMNWGVPVESIYLSKLKGEIPQRTFIFLTMSQLKPNDTVVKDTLFGSSFEKLGMRRLNSYYFQPDTSVAYKVMSYDSLIQ